MSIKKDALGNPMKIGQIYGYSNNKNGFTSVTVGKFVKETEKMASLEVIFKGSALYSKDIKEDIIYKKIISCKANMLFPIHADFLK